MPDPENPKSAGRQKLPSGLDAYLPSLSGRERHSSTQNNSSLAVGFGNMKAGPCVPMPMLQSLPRLPVRDPCVRTLATAGGVKLGVSGGWDITTGQ